MIIEDRKKIEEFIKGRGNKIVVFIERNNSVCRSVMDNLDYLKSQLRGYDLIFVPLGVSYRVYYPLSGLVWYQDKERMEEKYWSPLDNEITSVPTFFLLLDDKEVGRKSNFEDIDEVVAWVCSLRSC